MTETIRFHVAGMTCASCVNRITRSLKKLDGVVKVKVDLGRETATVVREPSVHDAVIAAAITAAGYEADMASAVLVTESPSRGVFARLRAVHLNTDATGHLH